MGMCDKEEKAAKRSFIKLAANVGIWSLIPLVPALSLWLRVWLEHEFSDTWRCGNKVSCSSKRKLSVVEMQVLAVGGLMVCTKFLGLGPGGM